MIAGGSFFDVVGVGKAYTDVIGKASYSLLEEYGIPLDMGKYFSVADIKKIRARLSSPEMSPGGTISNTLAGLVALGAKTGFFGKVAHDDAGPVFVEDLRARGIDVLGAPCVEGAPTSGICVVLLTEGGERSFALHNGCVHAFSREDFAAFDFSRVKIFLVASRLVVAPESVDAMIYAMRKAKEKGCQIAVSLSEVHDWTGHDRELIGDVVPCADILIGNESETEALFKLAGDMKDEDKTIVVTRGARGVTGRRGAEEKQVAACKNKGFVSSLGAGDQFLAGFLMGHAEGLSLEQKLVLGTRCAAEIIQRADARPARDADWGLLFEGL